MTYTLNIFVLLILAAIISSIALIIYSILKRTAEKSFFLIFLSIVTFLYNFGYLLEVTSSTLEAAFYSVRVQYMGIPFILPLSYLFIRDIYGEKRFKPSKLSLIFLIPFINMISLQAYPLFTMYYRDITYISNDFMANCKGSPGPLYYLGSLYNYFIYFLTIRIILRHFRSTSRLQRHQSFTMMIGFLIPLFTSTPYVFLPAKVQFDPNPFACSISLIILLYSVQYQNLLNVIPLARAQVIEAMEDAFIVCNNDFNFLDANRSAKLLFPQLNSLMAGERINEIDSFKREGELSLNTQGEMRFYKVTHTPILQGSKNSGICIVFHNITEEKKLLEKLRIQATVDPLMNIYNRETFFNLTKLITVPNNGGQLSYALLMIDIDHFKLVNDTYGHLCGDTVLESIASILQTHFHNDGIIGRYGGEEITVLLNNISAEQTFLTAENLRKTIENSSIPYQDHLVTITVSIGAAHSPAGESHSLEKLLVQADQALYYAKDKGRNCTYLYKKTGLL